MKKGLLSHRLLSSMTVSMAVTVSGVCSASSVSVPIEALLEMQLQQRYPDFQIKNVKPTPIENVFEIMIRNEIAYFVFDPKTKSHIGQPVKEGKLDPYRYFLLGGNFVDLVERRNLTAEARDKALRVDVRQFPLKDALTEKRGTRANVLYVISDPDCGHCRRLHQTLSHLKNVTIHTFLTPMGARIEPKLAEKASLIWCSENPIGSYDQAMRGEAIKGLANCETPIYRNLALAEKLHVRGTPTVFFADGTRIVGNQLNVQGFEDRFKSISTNVAQPSKKEPR